MKNIIVLIKTPFLIVNKGELPLLGKGYSPFGFSNEFLTAFTEKKLLPTA